MDGRVQYIYAMVLFQLGGHTTQHAYRDGLDTARVRQPWGLCQLHRPAEPRRDDRRGRKGRRRYEGRRQANPLSDRRGPTTKPAPTGAGFSIPKGVRPALRAARRG